MNYKRMLKKVYELGLSIIKPTRTSGKHGLQINKGNHNLLIGNKIKNRGKDNIIILDNDCKLHNCSIRFSGNNNSLIIHSGCQIVDVDFCFEDDNNLIEIGIGTRFVGDTHLACTEGKKIHIGDNCLFSNDLVMRTGDSHSVIDSDGNRSNYAKDVVIGDHVWSGNKVIILKGTDIGNNCIIGSGSVLSGKRFDASSVIAGNPAKCIKRNVGWTFERI